MDIFNSIGSALNAITNNSFTGKLMVSASALTTAFFTPIVGLLFACFSLNIADLISGLNVARKQGRKITSRKTWKGTINKILQESQLIVLLHIIEHFAFSAVGFDTTILTGGAAALMCLTEAWSILENMNTVNPDGPWKILNQFLRKKGEDLTGIEINLGEDGKINSVKPVDAEDISFKE